MIGEDEELGRHAKADPEMVRRTAAEINRPKPYTLWSKVNRSSPSAPKRIPTSLHTSEHTDVAKPWLCTTEVGPNGFAAKTEGMQQVLMFAVVKRTTLLHGCACCSLHAVASHSAAAVHYLSLATASSDALRSAAEHEFDVDVVQQNRLQTRRSINEPWRSDRVRTLRPTVKGAGYTIAYCGSK